MNPDDPETVVTESDGEACRQCGRAYLVPTDGRTRPWLCQGCWEDFMDVRRQRLEAQRQLRAEDASYEH